MAEAFKFELVSPERLLMSEEVEEVVVPGSEGEFGVLKDHAPFMSTIRPGVIVVRTASGDEKRIFIRGGFADTNPDGLTILAEQAIPLDELHPDEISTAIRETQEDVTDAKDDTVREAAELKLSQLKEVQIALGNS